MRHPLLALALIPSFVLALAVAPPALADEAEKQPAAEKDGEESSQTPRKSGEGSLDEPYSETMVITASRTEEALIDAPVAVSVVGAEQIETTPADNYADLLRGVPGLNVVQMSARDINFTSRVAATTLATSQLALVDGRSVYQDFFGFVMWDVLPMNFEEVDSIEVLRGPGSAIWGPNAIAGVVNVRTKTPREIDGGQFVVGGGEQGTRYGSILWADAFEKFSYKISASWFEQDAWPRPATTPDGTPMPPYANEGSEQPKLDFRVDYEPEEGQAWSFRAGAARTSGIIHTGIGPFRVDDSTQAPYFETSFTGRKLDAKFYVNWIDGDATNVLNGLDFLFDSTTYVGDVSWQEPIGDKNLLVFGGDVRLNDFDLSIAPGEDSRREYGAFIEDQITFNDHVAWNVGVRFDDFDTIGSVVSPRTSLIFKPNPDNSIRLAYNKAYRAPSLINNFLGTTIIQGVTVDFGFGAGPQTFYFPSAAVGNPDLDEETVDAYEIGYTGNFGDKVTMTLALYQNVVQDNIDFYASKFYTPADPPPVIPGLPTIPVPPGPAALAVVHLPKEFSYRNVGEVTYQGVELGFNVRFTEGVSGQFSYTWQDEPDVKDDTPLQPLELGRPSEHQFHAGVNVQKGRYSGAFSVSYTDDAFWTDVLDARYWGETDAFWTVNGGFGAEINDHLKLQLNATNLLDEDIQQHVFGDIIGRKVTAEMRVTW